MKNTNTAIEKAKKFGGRILKLSSYLRNFKAHTEASLIIAKSGLSIGSNLCKVFDNDFNDDIYETFQDALKAAIETKFYLETMAECGILSKKQFESIYPECNELIEIIKEILKSVHDGA